MSDSNNPTISTSSNARSACDRYSTVGLNTGYLDSNCPDSAHTSRGDKLLSRQSSSRPGDSQSIESDPYPDPPGGLDVMPLTLPELFSGLDRHRPSDLTDYSERAGRTGDDTLYTEDVINIDDSRSMAGQTAGDVPLSFNGVKIGTIKRSDL